jgi:hypothetical protein
MAAWLEGLHCRMNRQIVFAWRDAWPVGVSLKLLGLGRTRGSQWRSHQGPGWAWHPPTGMLSSEKVSSLCAFLNPILSSFDIENICCLVKKYYPADFSNQERMQLEYQLPHFQLDICNHPELKGLSSLADLTSGLVKLYKDSSYPMIVKLLRLLLTLSVSTATTERAFSAIKFVKTRLRSKMGDAYYGIIWSFILKGN